MLNLFVNVFKIRPPAPRLLSSIKAGMDCILVVHDFIPRVQHCVRQVANVLGEWKATGWMDGWMVGIQH